MGQADQIPGREGIPFSFSNPFSNAFAN